MDVAKTGGGERPPWEKELFRSAESGHAAAFAFLAPADLYLRDEGGRSLLHVASTAGHPQVVFAILQCGGAAAVLNAQDGDGWAPVHFAASSGNSEIIDILLEQGADVNLVTDGGQTPLHYAASKGRLNIAEKLLAHGAEVDVVDKTGQTPLMIALRSENRQVVLLLIRHSTDVKKNSFHSDYYIKLLHSRFWRFNQAPSHCCYDSPPPILQLTFHSDFDCNIELCHDPLTYFRFNRAIDFLSDHKLV